MLKGFLYIETILVAYNVCDYQKFICKCSHCEPLTVTDGVTYVMTLFNLPENESLDFPLVKRELLNKS